MDAKKSPWVSCSLSPQALGAAVSALPVFPLTAATSVATTAGILATTAGILAASTAGGLVIAGPSAIGLVPQI